MGENYLIPLSALQHYAFCPRQYALIYIEQVWTENWLTAQGRQLHQRVDSKEPETRKGIRYERGVDVCASKLGLIGKLDLVEVDLSTGQHCPVEYKRGKPKKDDSDHLQLCAQGLCLEEMLQKTILHGFMWYWQTRHRELVPFSDELRGRTYESIKKVRELISSGITPRAVYEKKCNACSLFDICKPKAMQSDHSKMYMNKLFDLKRLSDEETPE